jgi:maleylpyruvate isomerase
MTLHGYFRSTAAWRVRIALALKGLPYDQAFHHLRRGEQRGPNFLEMNPQGLVPALVVDAGDVLTQSLAIIEYLEETHPEPPLLPSCPPSRAKVRAFAQAIACDIHPVQNLRVLDRLRALGLKEPEVQAWARDVIDQGLTACERLIADETGPFAFGQSPGLADLCLVPQLFNARRFGVDMRSGRLLAVEAACSQLPAFVVSRPENQPDAE